MYEQIIGLDIDFAPFPHVSSACQDLLRGMLSKDWRQRPTMEEIRAHPWFQQFKHLQKPMVRRSSTMTEERGSGQQERPKTPKTPTTPRSANKWTPKVTWKKRKLVF